MNLQTLRAAARNSLVVQSLRWLAGALLTHGAAVARDLAVSDVRPGDDRELATVFGVVVSDRPGALVSNLLSGIERAWSDARVRNEVWRAATTLEALALWQRLRAVGVIIVVAAATDGALRLFDQRPAATLRLWLWSATCAAGIALYVLAEPLSRAWFERRHSIFHR